MSDIKEIANSFFEDCEVGKGWEVCKNYCLDTQIGCKESAQFYRTAVMRLNQ